MKKRMMVRFLIVATAAGRLGASTYYVDFESGNDSRPGTSPEQSWKHCPGDTAAADSAAAAKLCPGDTVLFKGGVVYRGSVAVKASGEAGRPIVFDGNSAGTWGNGRAVIDGGSPITGWKKCRSAEEAKGNPLWADIFYTDVSKPKDYSSLNLCDPATALPVAQYPNPKDFFWQEHKDNYLTATSLIVSAGGLRISAEKGTREDKQLPIGGLLTGNPAVVSPIPGCGFTCTLTNASEITAVGLSVPPNYPAIKDVAVLGDDKELLRLSLEKTGNGRLQRFELPAPVTVTRLTFRILSLHDGETANWSKLKQIAAFNREGPDLLKGTSNDMLFSDPANLNRLSGKQSGWFDGMTFAFHGGNNHILYLPVKGFNPDTGTLTLGTLNDAQYKQTAYCLFNSVRLIDRPGEYSVEPLPDPDMSRVFLLPPAVKDGQPVDVAASVRSTGFALESASHITVQGFVLRRQSGTALSAKGPAAGIIFRDCEATLVRGTVVSAGRIDDILIERCYVHDNPGHSKGIVLHTCTRAVTRDCRMVRNTSTAIDYYVCSDGHVTGNTVLENRGSHANGLTFYVGCKNILVERNIVAKGNCALTFQEGENLIFRNNLFDGNGQTTVVGIWNAPPLKNVQFLNNTIVRGNSASDYQVGLFSNSRKIEGLVVQNNIIDGLFSDYDVFRPGMFRNNLYTRTGRDQAKGLLGTNERVETDLKKIFVDPDNGDFRLCEGSPAIGAGTDAGITEDITGRPRPSGQFDIGAYAFQ